MTRVVSHLTMNPVVAIVSVQLATAAEILPPLLPKNGCCRWGAIVSVQLATAAEILPPLLPKNGCCRWGTIVSLQLATAAEILPPLLPKNGCCRWGTIVSVQLLRTRKTHRHCGATPLFPFVALMNRHLQLDRHHLIAPTLGGCWVVDGPRIRQVPPFSLALGASTLLS